MSMWTYIIGTIRVSVPGRTSAETKYILEMILYHLPQVTGSENDMDISILLSDYSYISDDEDEFGNRTETVKCNGFRINTDYLLVLEGNLRDRTFDRTKRDFIKWLYRLAKRIEVGDICVKISDRTDHELGITDAVPFSEMYEMPPDNSMWIEKIGGKKWLKRLVYLRDWEDDEESGN